MINASIVVLLGTWVLPAVAVPAWMELSVAGTVGAIRVPIRLWRDPRADRSAGLVTQECRGSACCRRDIPKG